MTRSEHDFLVSDDDPHALLFGDEDEHEVARGESQMSRTERRRYHAELARSHRRRRTRRGLLVLATLLVVVVVLAVWFVARPIYNGRYHPKDYAGAGTGTVLVRVSAGDGASDIGHTLVHDGVVASTRAFTNAAADNAKSKLIQPGSYQLRLHMSASSALALLLAPASRVQARVVVPEGATTLQVVSALASALHVSVASVKAAVDDPGALGLPSTYTVGSGAPKSVEGFLYPATYAFDPGTAPATALTQMINNFIDKDRASGFAAATQRLKLTPYQALIVASIAQAEAKYPADMAKVTRVILNRMARGMPLQIDATSVYGAKLEGRDPTKVIFATLDSPYNSYTHDGLPPTPISNPGPDALAGTARPAAGDWLYYVNSDAKGHLFFTASESAFEAAAAKCRANNWGCG